MPPLLCPFLSCCGHAFYHKPLIKILILQLDFPAWPQACLTTAACSGNHWAVLALISATRPALLRHLAAVGVHFSSRISTPACHSLPGMPSLQSRRLLLPPPCKRFIPPHLQHGVLVPLLLAERWFPTATSSSTLEFVRHIWKLDTKNIQILKISSLERVLAFLCDGYLLFL